MMWLLLFVRTARTNVPLLAYHSRTLFRRNAVKLLILALLLGTAPGIYQLSTRCWFHVCALCTLDVNFDAVLIPKPSSFQFIAELFTPNMVIRCLAIELGIQEPSLSFPIIILLIASQAVYRLSTSVFRGPAQVPSSQFIAYTPTRRDQFRPSCRSDLFGSSSVKHAAFLIHQHYLLLDEPFSRLHPNIPHLAVLTSSVSSLRIYLETMHTRSSFIQEQLHPYHGELLVPGLFQLLSNVDQRCRARFPAVRGYVFWLFGYE
ncbi:hypothetical protein JAAARDRAFT_411470 [Jaapia argillacea MUCL 33604]|uniref:Uncharacterized protein n=1 Tax=Jaapia argillacea MUCL 33604 TaxID=933084 RepID=A0A067PS16_9AGAM|nr:hypothetical protein JAAARDRAFT_411470 [Jaapia argillacea MUCL 33604]